MGLFDFLKPPTLMHPRFGAMKFSRDYWQCEADYLGTPDVRLMLQGGKEGIDPSAQAICDELETRFAGLKDTIGQALYEDSYMPVREAIDAGEYPKYVGDEIPVLESQADVWKHLRLAWITFDAGNGPDYIMIAVETEWEIEHTLGIGIRDWQFDYLNGSVIPA